MKTTNNVQKTSLRKLTAVVVLAVFGFSVNAQGALIPDFENNTGKQMAFAGSMNSNFSAYAKSATGNETAMATYLAAATEEPLHVENWMTETENFDATPVAFETVSDEELTIEDWMMNTKTFETKKAANQSTPVKGKKLFFEFSTTKFVIREITNEPSLKLENWMYNNKNWK